MQAIILAAGRGSRLGPLTDSQTKCMVKVCGKTLIERSVESILDVGIKKIIIVTGYKKEGLTKHLKLKFPNCDIKFVFSEDFYKTNNIYSLYVVKDLLIQDDTILLESDLIFEQDILSKLISDPRKNLVVVDKFKNWHDGTVVKINQDQKIQSFIPKSEFSYKDLIQYFKTVNIYKFSKDFLVNVYEPFLQAYCRSFGRSEYYEDVLRVIALIKNQSLEALVLKNEKWYEIDTVEDKENAEIIFSNPKQQYELLTKTYGGYWRFEDLLDFCYLVNPFFPPQSLVDELNFNLLDLMQSYPSGSKIQSRLGAKMFGIDPSQIVVGNGSAELIKIASKFLKKSLAIHKPTFDEYTSTFSNLDFQFSDNDGFEYSASDIVKIANKKDGAILINPDNPSGNFIPHKELIEVLKVFKKNNKILILDESFLDFAEKGFESSLCSPKILKDFSNLIIIKSIGKSYGIGGLRLGVLISSNTKLISKIKSELPIWNINSISEFYLQIIGKYTSEYIESCQKLIEARNFLKKSLNKVPYIKCYDSQANFLLCELVGKQSRDLAIELCQKYKILIKDCSEKCNNGRQYIRIAVRDFDDNEKLIKALNDINI